MILQKYSDDLNVMNIEAQQLEDWDYRDATNIRLSVPADFPDAAELLQRGFMFADRMYEVSINLARSKVDYAKLVRLKPELVHLKPELEGCSQESAAEDVDILKTIAHNSFKTDRRFHVDAAYNQDKANRLMDQWIDELQEVYVCRYKEDVAGFLALQKPDANNALVYLAAVEEKYRPAGVALSMYAYAVEECRQQGYRAVKGYISSRNIPVLNLYTYLGATFERATDVYIKERRQ